MLADIEIAQNLKAETEKAQEQMEVEKVPHALDQNYLSLSCKLSLLQRDTQEFKVLWSLIEVEFYTNTTVLFKIRQVFSDILMVIFKWVTIFTVTKHHLYYKEKNIANVKLPLYFHSCLI